jgi:uncharacterized Zn finger protein
MPFGWKPYVSAAERKRLAARAMAKLKKKGHAVAPVVINGKTIATTFWGKAWCDNLEGYSDFANRLPRGRTYVRNGSVVDLQIGARQVRATVSGSALYQVELTVAAVPKARWSAICKDSAGAIDSVVELLQGRLSNAVMARLCQQRTGLFPSPQELELSCSCPDWASMCKHIAAVLYGIGARLDEQPELLFRLREVDEKELIAQAGSGLGLAGSTGMPAKKGKSRILASGDLGALFGLDLAEIAEPAQDEPASKETAKKPVKKAQTPAALPRKTPITPPATKRTKTPKPRRRS